MNNPFDYETTCGLYCGWNNPLVDNDEQIFIVNFELDSDGYATVHSVTAKNRDSALALVMESIINNVGDFDHLEELIQDDADEILKQLKHESCSDLEEDHYYRGRRL